MPGDWKGTMCTDGVKVPLFWCPDCGKDMFLHLHNISVIGNVQEIVLCPRDGCDFEAQVTLGSWGPKESGDASRDASR